MNTAKPIALTPKEVIYRMNILRDNLMTFIPHHPWMLEPLVEFEDIQRRLGGTVETFGLSRACCAAALGEARRMYRERRDGDA